MMELLLESDQHHHYSGARKGHQPWDMVIFWHTTTKVCGESLIERIFARQSLSLRRAAAGIQHFLACIFSCSWFLFKKMIACRAVDDEALRVARVTCDTFCMVNEAHEQNPKQLRQE